MIHFCCLLNHIIASVSNARVTLKEATATAGLTYPKLFTVTLQPTIKLTVCEDRHRRQQQQQCSELNKKPARIQFATSLSVLHCTGAIVIAGLVLCTVVQVYSTHEQAAYFENW